MKKSRIQLLFKVYIIFLFFLSIIRLVIYNVSYNLLYEDGNSYGTVVNITKKDDYIVMDISGKVNYKAYYYGKNKIDFGDKIYFNFKNINVSNNTVFNTFNYKKYLKSKNIRQVVEIKSFNIISQSKFYFIKGSFYKKILKRKSNSYIFTFICGDKSYLDSDVKTSYSSNGISHLLCVSGFHVAFLFNFLINFFDSVLKKRNLSIILLTVISVLYLIATNFMISLFRSIIMYFLTYMKDTKKIKISPIYIFLFTLFLSITIWPNIIYDIGFYYTFMLTIFLLLHKGEFKSIFNVSIYCFIISMPLTIYINYSVNLLGIVYGALSSFFVCYILYPLSFIAIFSNIADILLYKLSVFFEYINVKLDSIKMFQLIIPKTSIYLIIFIYILYIIYILKPNRYVVITYLLVLIYMFFNKYFMSSYYIYYLDVKQGDMSVIIAKNFKTVTVIDTGGIVMNKSLNQVVKVFLHSIGVVKINNLVITHGDYDHMGEAINLVNNFKVKKVIFNCGPYNDLEKKLIKVLDKKKIKFYSCVKELNIDNNKLYFLQTKEYDNENDNSNVIYTELDGYKFMFMGDASVTTEKEIMNKYNLHDIDVLKVGHHGSKTSSSREFINEVNPNYSIISVGKNNKYGHPNKEVLENLKNSKIYRTDQDGSIMFKIKNSKLKIEMCCP